MLNIFPPNTYFYINQNLIPIDDSFRFQVSIPEQIMCASEHRQREYLHGRYCAQQALQQFFSDTQNSIHHHGEVGRNENTGAPIWPSPVCGSISHGANATIAVVANIQHIASCGVDIETIGRVKRPMWRKIMASAEESIYRQKYQDVPEDLFATLIFSAKESLFKAIFPLEKTFITFRQVTFREFSLEKNYFVLQYAGNNYHGRFQVLGSDLISIVAIEK